MSIAAGACTGDLINNKTTGRASHTASGCRCVAAALVGFGGDGPLGAEARRLGDRSVEEIFELWKPVDAVEGLGNLQGTDEQIDDG